MSMDKSNHSSGEEPSDGNEDGRQSLLLFLVLATFWSFRLRNHCHMIQCGASRQLRSFWNIQIQENLFSDLPRVDWSGWRTWPIASLPWIPSYDKHCILDVLCWGETANFRPSWICPLDHTAVQASGDVHEIKGSKIAPEEIKVASVMYGLHLSSKTKELRTLA